MTTLPRPPLKPTALSGLAALVWQVAQGPETMHPGRASGLQASVGAYAGGRALARLNPDFPDAALDGAFRKLTHNEGPTLEVHKSPVA